MTLHRSLILFVTLFVGYALSPALLAADWWAPTAGPVGADVYCLAANSQGHLFVGTNGKGVYRSTDNGDSWVQVNTGLTNLAVHSLTVSSSDELFAGTEKGVFLSSDRGDNWQEKGLSSRRIYSLAVNPGGHLYAGTDAGLYRSTTKGDSWTEKYVGGWGGITVNAIAIDAAWHVFAGAGQSVFRSTDNGDSWSTFSLSTTPRSLAINSVGYVFAGTSNKGIYRSTDNGGHWTQATTGLTSMDVRSLVLDASGHVFAATYGGGVFRSDDDGNSWTPVNQGLINPFVTALAISPSGRLFAGSWGNGVFRSVEAVTTDAEYPLFFAQLGGGGGLTSEAVLTNPWPTATASGRIDFYADDGNPLPIGVAATAPDQMTLSMQRPLAVTNGVDFTIPPLGEVTISSSAEGALVVGSAIVTCDHAVGGVVRFKIPGVGIAGVGDSQPVQGFIIPVRKTLGGIRTGVAIHNTETRVVTLTLTLRGKDGKEATNGSRVIESFPAKGHLARFIDELFPDAAAKEFEGTLSVQVTDGRVAATALELGPNAGEFTTLPVTPLPPK